MKFAKAVSTTSTEVAPDVDSVAQASAIASTMIHCSRKHGPWRLEWRAGWLPVLFSSSSIIVRCGLRRSSMSNPWWRRNIYTWSSV